MNEGWFLFGFIFALSWIPLIRQHVRERVFTSRNVKSGRIVKVRLIWRRGFPV